MRPLIGHGHELPLRKSTTPQPRRRWHLSGVRPVCTHLSTTSRPVSEWLSHLAQADGELLVRWVTEGRDASDANAKRQLVIGFA